MSGHRTGSSRRASRRSRPETGNWPTLAGIYSFTDLSESAAMNMSCLKQQCFLLMAVFYGMPLCAQQAVIGIAAPRPLIINSGPQVAQPGSATSITTFGGFSVGTGIPAGANITTNPVGPLPVAGTGLVTLNAGSPGSGTGAAVGLPISSVKIPVNWQQFSIQPADVSKFAQPNVGAVTLSQVTGATTSALGTLQATGAGNALQVITGQGVFHIATTPPPAGAATRAVVDADGRVTLTSGR